MNQNGEVPVLKDGLVRGKEWFLDAFDTLLGRRHWSNPPRRLQFVGGGDFTRTGERYLGFFVDVCGLAPDDRVLDVGCGVGRMAVPLTRYLSPAGAYRGFDVVRPGIEWCRKAITSRFPHFQFEWVDVYNQTYNSKGSLPAEKFRFPYGDKEFDFIFLTSVFTHMLPNDLKHYLAEIVRVLRPGGSCAVTYFLLNDESRQSISRGVSRLDFKYEAAGCLTVDWAAPESAVAYDEASIVDLYATMGLVVSHPVYYGSWCGRRGPLRFQDVIVASKR